MVGPLPDVIVVGLGAVGSAVIRHLARRGASVVGIDRLRPPHDRGSSHGATRITRLAIGEGHEYVPLVQRSHVLWRELEAETGAHLMQTTGGLVVAAPESDAASFHGRRGFFERTVDAAERFGIAHERLDAADIARRWPAFQPRGDERGYLEPEAGILRPEACVQAQLDAAARDGAVLRLDETVLRIDLVDGRPSVLTDRWTVAAAHVVIAAGPWLPGLLAPAEAARFAVRRQVLHWFHTDAPELYAPGRLPVFIWMHGARGEAFYGVPMADAYAGVKVATEQAVTTTTPDAVERRVSAAETAAMFDTHIRGRLQGLRPTTVHDAACLYTSLPEGRFVVDRHPTLDHVTVVSACSGHGFKHSAAIGEAVAETVLDRAPRIDLAAFSWAALRRSGPDETMPPPDYGRAPCAS
ncbi:MAG TPA: N-methyl-L-tryptophan oxidase [Caldimonas sp.]